jgi:serine/threonine protein kinase
MGNDVRIGKFQVVGVLGAGAHSKIVQIRRSTDGANYALKIVPIAGPDEKKFLDQAEHEFRVAQMLDHPHLIKVYALETTKDWLFRVTKVQLLIEYVNGKTLDAIPRLPLPKLVQVFERVARGLVHMHRRGVAHGDLKPNNVLVGPAGAVKVIDYGLAHIKGELKDRIQGTPEYMAPETAQHKMVNERSDIFNLGGALYRMVTTKFPPRVLSDRSLPLDAKTWQSLLKPVNELTPGVPAPLCELIHACLAFDVTKRPGRMSEVQGALDRIADGLIKTPDDRLDAAD